MTVNDFLFLCLRHCNYSSYLATVIFSKQTAAGCRSTRCDALRLLIHRVGSEVGIPQSCAHVILLQISALCKIFLPFCSVTLVQNAACVAANFTAAAQRVYTAVFIRNRVGKSCQNYSTSRGPRCRRHSARSCSCRRLADAHGTGKRVAMHLAERLHLHGGRPAASTGASSSC